MRQTTLATAGFERYRKPTLREMFLAEMDRVVPWRQLCTLIAPVYPNSGKGRTPVGLATAFTHFSCCLSWALILDDLCSEGERDGGSRRSFGTFW